MTDMPISENVIPMVHAFIDDRDAEGWETYEKALTTFDGRHSIADAQEEAADLLNYLTKLRREWTVIADLLERASVHIAIDYLDDDAVALSNELRETAARMRQDVTRVGVPASAGPMERLEAMDGEA